MRWQTARRKISLEKTLVMAILNVTPDSFSDGGNFLSISDALKQAEKHIDEGADILDIGGESTRPNSRQISVEEEIKRTAPIVEAIAKRFDLPISIDTSKSQVAEKAVETGAEIINDISGLRFDEKIAQVAAANKTGLVLMHLSGTFETMHRQEAVENILREVGDGFSFSLNRAKNYNVADEQIVLDAGIGFSKTFAQNLELIAKLDKLVKEFPNYPMLIGASRKSFLGKILGGALAAERLNGSLASASISVWNGAKILRVHDVKATVEAIKIVEAIKQNL